MRKNNFEQNKEEVKPIDAIPGKPARRSITSHDLGRYNIKKEVNVVPAIDKRQIPKKKDSRILIGKNLLDYKGNNIPSINTANSMEINKMKNNNNKDYPLIDKDRKTYLYQQKNNDSKREIDNLQINQEEDNINLNEQKKDSIEIINYIDSNKSYINENIKISEEMKIYDTFCIGVFVSGVSPPIKNSSIIENSEAFIAPCGHLQCSLYPSIQPQLLHTYINKNMKTFNNLSHLVSNMCFPLGIKPCFGCRFDENKKIDNLPNPQQVFFNIIKNEKGETYYIATLQYFIKMSNSEYLMKYKFNPITYFLEKSGNNSNNKDKKFFHN